MHCGVVRQAVKILNISRDCLRTGDKDNLTFWFLYNSEFIKPGQKFLLREGRTKILGLILSVSTDKLEINNN